jgi:hypothetical protein
MDPNKACVVCFEEPVQGEYSTCSPMFTPAATELSHRVCQPCLNSFLSNQNGASLRHRSTGTHILCPDVACTHFFRFDAIADSVDPATLALVQEVHPTSDCPRRHHGLAALPEGHRLVDDA